MNADRALTIAAVNRARSDFLASLGPLDDKAVTPGQKAMQAKFGNCTPREFAEGCADALGEISWAEAEQAVKQFVRDWSEA